MLATIVAPGAALGHVVAAPDSPPTLGTAWSVDPYAPPVLLLIILLYGLGLRVLWRRGAGHGVSVARAAGFLAGWAVLGFAMIWPLDAFGAWLLSAHMAQHMLLMAVAPPLLLLGHPGPVVLAALPAGWARRVMHRLRRPGIHKLWMTATAPMFAMMLQAAVMWGWHLPAAMDIALRSEPVHYLMHASFLFSGLLFWTALARSLHEPAPGAGAGALAIVGTMIQMGLLSALLTFAPEPRFAYYYDRAPLLGLTALEDQQLAGLIMWVPAALPYLIGGVALAAAWLRRAERQSGMPAPTALPHRHDGPAV